MEVYADAAAVRLKLNGETVASKTVRDYKTIFCLRYAPGILTAQALDARGNVLSESSLATGGEGTILTVRPEKTSIRADGQDLCYIPIEFTDQDGVLKPYMEQSVTLSVTGAAKLAGFGSALCKTDEVFDKNEHRAYRGRCLAVLRAGTVQGTAEVTVKSAGARPVTVEIEVR